MPTMKPHNIRKKRKLQNKKFGWARHIVNVRDSAKKKGKTLSSDELPKFKLFTNFPVIYPTPSHSKTVIYIATKILQDIHQTDVPLDGVFTVPANFSLCNNYEVSFHFLKLLFFALYNETHVKIVIDYRECERFDVDASVCMDIMLGEFINYAKKCNRFNYACKVDEITPIHFENDSVKKMLFSIGAFKNLRNREIRFKDIIPFPLQRGDNESANRGSENEVEVTKLVDYILECLGKLNKTLTWQAESQLSKVIGEVLINAAEHSKMPSRYSIGYFQELSDHDQIVGVFNMTILSFGNSIYENFNSEEASSLEVVHRMRQLSQKYTKQNLFKSRQFEEETLWTLYALQEGVTSVRDRKRGNGSIQYIENFFSLKGDMNPDNLSSLTIISGNTKIIFDGKYKIQSKIKEGRHFKVMTFNDTGEIDQKPDEKYVTFTGNIFPGTLIAAKICINFNSVEKEAK
jgi:hypothetical protein